MKNPFEKLIRKQPQESAKTTEWDNLNAVDFAGDTTEIIDPSKDRAERQQRKITAYLLYGKNKEYISAPDVRLNAGDEDQLSAKLLDGSITQRDKIELLATIKKGPIDKFNPEKIYSDITRDKHFSRIIGYLQNGKKGFDDFQHNFAGFEQLAMQNPTPIEFEGKITNLLEDLKSTQSPEKYAEYVRDIESLERTMYGKRYEYYEQIKVLDAAAEERKKQKEMIPSANTGEQAETLVNDFGYYEMSRAQARSGITINSASERLPQDYTEDAHLEMPEQNLFAIFDGAGGTNNINGGARIASQTASEKVRDLATRFNLKTEGNLAWALNHASAAIEADPRAGVTTGTVAKVIEENGIKKLAYASVGDSRIYIVRENSTAFQVTKDEGFGNKITNALGKISSEIPSSDRTQQTGLIDLRPGDRIILCTDGITGDKPEETMSNDQIANIVGLAWNTSQAAAELVDTAKKKDDRTAIVFQV